jgi:hypothetical protein
MNPVRIPVVSTLLCLTFLLPACSDVAKREDAARARYHAYAGAPVDSFTWLGRYDGWTSLGNNELVIWTTPFDAYLIRVMPPCIDLPFTNAIGVTSTARTVSARFDFVLVHGQGARSPAANFRCPIAEIRPVDYKRMRREQREQGPLPGAQPAPPPGQSQSSSGT